MDILLRNTEKGLVPEYASDLDEKKKLKMGELYSAKIVKMRNYRFLKKFMALCRYGSENSKNVSMPLTAYRKYVTMKAGYFITYKTPKGVMIEAESIAFEKMDENTFSEVYSRVLDVIIEDTQATQHDIEKELINFF